MRGFFNSTKHKGTKLNEEEKENEMNMRALFRFRSFLFAHHFVHSLRSFMLWWQ